MKKIMTEIWVPCEKKGYVKLAGQRKAEDVFNELKATLREENLYPSEYLLMNSDLSSTGEELIPHIDDMKCYTRWGGSEGIYFDIDIYSYIEDQGKFSVTHFATGKTLDESAEAYDRMQYIAGYIYRLFMGNCISHARYMLFGGESRKNMETLLANVKIEAIEAVKRELFHQSEETPLENANEIALSLMIMKVLSRCQLPEDKLKGLFGHKNILAYLRELCSSVMESNMYEIEEIIMSYSSFALNKE